MVSYKKNGNIGVKEITVLVLLCFLSLLFISFYLPPDVSGAMGVALRYITCGLFGPLYHFSLILILLAAFIVARSSRHPLPGALIFHSIILYLLVASLLQFFTLDQKDFINQVQQLTGYYRQTQGEGLWLNTSTLRASTAFNLLWQAGISPDNYPLLHNCRPMGIIAGTFSLAFYEMFGSLAGKVVLFALTLGELRIIFGFSALEWLLNLSDIVRRSHSNIKQAVQETLADMHAAELQKENYYTEAELEKPSEQIKLPARKLLQIEAGADEISTAETAAAAASVADINPNTSALAINAVTPSLPDAEDAPGTEEKMAAEAATTVPVVIPINTAQYLSDAGQQPQTADANEPQLQDSTHLTAENDSVGKEELPEPQLIDTSRWQQQAAGKILPEIRHSNIFNPAFVETLPPESLEPDRETEVNVHNQPVILPAFNAVDNSLPSFLQKQAQADKKEFPGTTGEKLQAQAEKVGNLVADLQEPHTGKIANEAENSALAREYRVLNSSSLQPQFTTVKHLVDVDPFKLNTTAASADVAGTFGDYNPLNNITADISPLNSSTYNSPAPVAEKEPAAIPETAAAAEPELARESETAAAQEAAITQETAAFAPAPAASSQTNGPTAIDRAAAAHFTDKKVEVVADLDLSKDNVEEEHKTTAANSRQLIYTARDRKDSLLKQAALEELTRKPDSPKKPYIYPDLDLLTPVQNNRNNNSEAEIRALADKLEFTLKSFGVDAEVINITTGPTITRFELSPGVGVKVSKIVNLNDDIALSLAATGVRIEAPIPGKSAIGIEIPNKDKRIVDLRSILAGNDWKNNNKPLKVALGRDIPGQPIVADLADMTHTLIAGATGSGKSICINAILISLLYHCHPKDLKLIMVDPKVVELSVYNGIPHLLVPVVTDPKKAAEALNWACVEMGRRYELLARAAVRDIKSYNEYVAKNQGVRKTVKQTDGQMVYEVMEHMPYLVVIIDELADLMMTAPQEVEDAINRIAAKGRACGIHLILATQRPSVDVITGVIKANVPSRIAFAVSSQVDSRTILDGSGAEKLLGKGDMLYNPRGAIKPLRGQGAFISDQDVEAVVDFLKEADADYVTEPVDIFTSQNNGTGDSGADNDRDELFDAAVEIIMEAGYASVSILQRRLNIGYPRAGRLIDSLERAGIIGPANGSKPREIRISRN